MSEMFKNYPQPDDYKPDNRPKHKCPFKLDIMVGETTVHSFDIPFNIEDDCINWYIIYKLGVETVLTVTKDRIDIITEDDDTSIISCSLTPTETRLFDSTVLNTAVQIKFEMKDGSVVFSEIYPVKIRNSLEV